jgi:hypothetical protein
VKQDRRVFLTRSRPSVRFGVIPGLPVEVVQLGRDQDRAGRDRAVRIGIRNATAGLQEALDVEIHRWVVPGRIVKWYGLHGVDEDLLGLGPVLGIEVRGALQRARGGDMADDPVPGVLGIVLLDQEPDVQSTDPRPERGIDRPAMGGRS